MKPRHRILALVVAVVLAAAVVLIASAVPRRPQPAQSPSGETTRSLDTLEATRAPLRELPPSGIATAPAPLQPTEPRAFDVDAAMADVRVLEAFGVRPGGSDAEARTAAWLHAQLEGMGLDARIEEFTLPSGATSRNVVARIEGSSDAVVVLGAHFDTKPPSPGANDNASGCAALLEIARSLTESPVVPTLEIVFFGSEETLGRDPNAHHFGSRHRVSVMSGTQRRLTAGMISLDMIGYGPAFHSRTMGRGPMLLSDMFLAHARSLGIGMTYRKDPGSSGWSDHEAYELAGVPVSWIQWRDDPVYHTAGDVSGHLQPDRIETAGRLVLEFLRSLDAQALERLLGR